MRTFNIIMHAAILAHFATATSAQESPTIKGWAIGQPPELACRGEPITDMQDLLDKAGIKDIKANIVSCLVRVGSVAGVTVTKPVKIIFLRRRLVRVLIDFGWLDLESLAAVRGTLVETYGRPTTRRSKQFATDSWSTGPSQIELEQSNDLPSSVGLQLTDTFAWAEYEQVSKQISDQIKARRRFDRRNDLKN